LQRLVEIAEACELAQLDQLGAHFLKLLDELRVFKPQIFLDQAQGAAGVRHRMGNTLAELTPTKSIA
jgi:hypothetical protein